MNYTGPTFGPLTTPIEAEIIRFLIGAHLSGTVNAYDIARRLQDGLPGTPEFVSARQLGGDGASESVLATRTEPGVVAPINPPVAGQDYVPPGGAVEAALTDVVVGLRDCWLSSMARHWDRVGAINAFAGTQFEKDVAHILRGTFADYSELLIQAGMLLLDRRKSAIEREKGVASIDELAVHLREYRQKLACLSMGSVRARTHSGDWVD